MKILITFALVLLSLSAFSQDEKVSFSVEGTFGFSDNFYSNDGSVPANVESRFSELEVGVLAYDLGGIASIRLREKLELQTGVKILVEGTATEKRDLKWGNDFMGFDSNGEPILVTSLDNPNGIKFSDRSFYLEIPVRLNVRLKGKLKAFKLSFGQSPTFNILNTSRVTKYFEDREEVGSIENATTDFRRVNANTQIGFIWEKEMKKRNSFYIFPNMRVQTLGRSKDATLNRRFFLAGVSAGITI